MTPGEVFERHRPRLRAVAYGIVGEHDAAQDAVQEAWLRWRDVDPGTIRSPEGFLVTTVTRLAIDELRSARARREVYTGTWLPDPDVRDLADPTDPLVLGERLTLALLCALERLNPLQRAVLVLRDAFDLEYAEIAEALAVSPANARQLAKRARDRVADAARARPVPPQERERLTAAFLAAAQDGDVDRLRDLLAADAVQYSDGGGHGNVARSPIRGGPKIAAFWGTIRRRGQFPADLVPRAVSVNGDLGVCLASPATGPYAITAVQVADGRVVAIRNFVNPERFAALHPEAGARQPSPPPARRPRVRAATARPRTSGTG